MKIKWNSEQIPKMNVKNNKDVTFLTYPAYEEMNWLVPVSYTHLDVYKRQGNGKGFGCKSGRKRCA